MYKRVLEFPLKLHYHLIPTQFFSTVLHISIPHISIPYISIPHTQLTNTIKSSNNSLFFLSLNLLTSFRSKCNLPSFSQWQLLLYLQQQRLLKLPHFTCFMSSGSMMPKASDSQRPQTEVKMFSFTTQLFKWLVLGLCTKGNALRHKLSQVQKVHSWRMFILAE